MAISAVMNGGSDQRSGSQPFGVCTYSLWNGGLFGATYCEFPNHLIDRFMIVLSLYCGKALVLILFCLHDFYQMLKIICYWLLGWSSTASTISKDKPSWIYVYICIHIYIYVYIHTHIKMNHWKYLQDSALPQLSALL